jgi:apolipoprotein N-acyltransferase
MATENLRDSSLIRAVTDLLADLSDLIQKEVQLARAEVGQKISAKLAGSGWVAAAGILGLIALLVVVEAAVFAIASSGLALYWACLIVAAILAAAAAAVFYHGRSLAEEDLLPVRSVRQVKQDIEVTKEQLT